MRRLIMPMATSMCRITLRQLFIMHQLMIAMATVEATSYSGDYGYSSGGVYSNSNGTYYPNYVPQSAYYSKEAQLVAEEGGNNSSKVNYSTDKEDNSLLNFGESVWSSSLGESLKNVTRFAPWQISSFVDYGTQIVSGEDANDALNKTAVHAGLSAVGDVAGEYVAEEIGGMLGTALAPGVGQQSLELE